jgi:hypothetical protein
MSFCRTTHNSGAARMRRTLMGLMLGVICFAAAPHARAASPCCGITSVDKKTGVVTARENATGRVFTFKATGATLATLKPGQAVYANFGAKQVSINGEAPCCGILSIAAAPVGVGQTVAKPKLATDSAAIGQLGTGGQVTLGPCCTVTELTAPNYVTAQSTTGTYFVFTLNSLPGTALLSVQPITMKVGQKLYANFSTNQVSLDGSSPTGSIQWICPGAPANQCPVGAASCVTSTFNANKGCPTYTYQTSTPTSCKAGYYGADCSPCSNQCANTCNQGITGNGLCP